MPKIPIRTLDPRLPGAVHQQDSARSRSWRNYLNAVHVLEEFAATDPAYLLQVCNPASAGTPSKPLNCVVQKQRRNVIALLGKPSSQRGRITHAGRLAQPARKLVHYPSMHCSIRNCAPNARQDAESLPEFLPSAKGQADAR